MVTVEDDARVRGRKVIRGWCPALLVGGVRLEVELGLGFTPAAVHRAVQCVENMLIEVAERLEAEVPHAAGRG